MAAQGGILFQEKVSRLINRRDQRPVLKPNRPLVLKDSVSNRKLKKGEATCVTEMSVLMACWKLNNFVDELCSNEVNSFYTCVKEARVAAKNKSEQSRLQEGYMPPKQATGLLKRYPTLRTEI